MGAISQLKLYIWWSSGKYLFQPYQVHWIWTKFQKYWDWDWSKRFQNIRICWFKLKLQKRCNFQLAWIKWGTPFPWRLPLVISNQDLSKIPSGNLKSALDDMHDDLLSLIHQMSRITQNLSTLNNLGQDSDSFQEPLHYPTSNWVT